MAITQISFNANQAGVFPATQTDAGYKLDHKAYSVAVNLSADLMAALDAAKGGGTVVCRFDVFDSAGGYDRTPTKELTSQMEIEITKRMTRTPGVLRIEPIVTAVNGNITVFERTLGIIILKVKSTPGSDDNEYRDEDTLSSLEKSAREAAAIAAEAKEICLSAQAATEAAKAALEDDTTVIFDGGDSSGELPIEISVDNVISQNNMNAVTSGAVYAALALLQSNIESYIDTKYAALTAGLAETIEASITGKYFPVGNLIFSLDPDYDPNNDISGTAWELIGGGVTLVCAGTTDDNITYEVGDTGGERTHTLTVGEIPSHRHTLKVTKDNESTSGGGWPKGCAASGNNSGTLDFVNGANGTVGGSGAHNNMPPYLVVNIWKRIEISEEEE